MPVLMRRARACCCNSTKGFTARSKPRALRSPAGTLCPKARGLSPQHLMGADSLCVRCEAVLPLPPSFGWNTEDLQNQDLN